MNLVSPLKELSFAIRAKRRKYECEISRGQHMNESFTQRIQISGNNSFDVMVSMAKNYQKFPTPVCGAALILTVFLQVLAQGSSPLAYLSDHVKKYVACVKDKKKTGCDVILKPPKKEEEKEKAKVGRWEKIPKPIVHHI